MPRSAAERLQVAERLHALFNPRSIALVGATDRSGWSRYTFANLAEKSPGVELHLVNPQARDAHGRHAVGSVSELPGPADLAYVMVPAAASVGVVEEIAATGTKSVVMLTSGFAEVGPEGLALEERLMALVEANGMTILGPNGNGYINAAAGVIPFGLPITNPLITGPVGLVLQSGGLTSGVLAAASSNGIGVSLLCATGNESQISATDVMWQMLADPATRVIAAFLESIRDPEEFSDLAVAAAEAGKPLVVLKAGRSDAGAQAALSHTGALAGDDRVIDAAFRQLGVLRVDSLEELLGTAGTLGYHPLPRGGRIAAVTMSGGASDLLADKASEEGLSFPDFPEPTVDRLRQALPPYASPHNPLDVTGAVVVDPTLAPRSLDAVLPDVVDHYDMVFFQATQPRDPALADLDLGRLGRIAKVKAESPLPIYLFNYLNTPFNEYGARLASEEGLFWIPGIDCGTRCVGNALRYATTKDRAAGRRVAHAGAAPAMAIPEDAVGSWPEHLARPWLIDAGIPVVDGRLVTSADQAAEAVAGIGGSAVMKVAAPGLLHRSDIGGVQVGVDPRGAAAAYDRLLANYRASGASAPADGVLVEAMRPGGLELLVSVTTDAAWGKVLSVALGGVWVEALGDVSLAVLPVDEEEVLAMLDGLRGKSLLHGARGSVPVNLEALARIVVGIAGLAESAGDQLDTLEINPLWVEGDRAEVLDALMIWKDA